MGKYGQGYTIEIQLNLYLMFADQVPKLRGGNYPPFLTNHSQATEVLTVLQAHLDANIKPRVFDFALQLDLDGLLSEQYKAIVEAQSYPLLKLVREVLTMNMAMFMVELIGQQFDSQAELASVTVDLIRINLKTADHNHGKSIRQYLKSLAKDYQAIV